MTMHLVIPMSGEGKRFRAEGYEMVKPLVPVGEQPMVEVLLNSFPENWPCTFILSESEKKSALEPLLRKLRPSASIHYIPPHNFGPGYAILQARHILPDKDLLISYCDYGMRWDAQGFEKHLAETKPDFCTICYKGFHPHLLGTTLYATVRVENGLVVEIKEKGNFSSNRLEDFTSAGAYYFKSKALLLEGLAEQKKQNLLLNEEFYLSLTQQALLCGNSAKGTVFEIPFFYQLGTPEEKESFEYWQSAWKAWSAGRNNKKTIDELVITMAGKGSRFAGQAKAKAFIPVEGIPLYKVAISSLPQGNTTLVTLQDFEEELKDEAAQKIFLDSTPPGQAFTVAQVLDKLPEDKAIVVSSCDHEIVLSTEDWQAFRATGADAGIFCIKNYPGARRSPKSFAYVQIRDDDIFPHAHGMSVKKPLSKKAWQDWLFVGTFYFKNKKVLKAGLDSLLARKAIVNGELYLDSIFDDLITQAFDVRVIPISAYINYGDPDSKAEALYYKEIFLNGKV